MTTLMQIYLEIFQWKIFANRLRFDRIMAMSLCPHFLTHPVYRRALRIYRTKPERFHKVTKFHDFTKFAEKCKYLRGEVHDKT